MKNLIFLAFLIVLVGCGRGFEVRNYDAPPSVPENTTQTLFAVSSAIISVNAHGDLASMKVKKAPVYVSLLMSTAWAQAQASGVVSVTYSNPGATSFTLNTSSFMAGAYPQVSGDDLLLGNISLSALDDNSLRVCTGVGAPGNKCNRLYIRVFTLGSNISNSITGIPGFINTDSSSPYGIDVFAGSVLTPIGFNSNQNANTVTNAATVYQYTIGNSTNRVRLSDLGAVSFPMKASLANAGSGTYEMKLVVQYALGYVP